MIAINANNDIVVKVNDVTYNLSSTDDYKAFLIWITSPDSNVKINPSMFDVDPAAPEKSKDKLERYSKFLVEFAEKRAVSIKAFAEASSQRREQVGQLLAVLEGANSH